MPKNFGKEVAKLLPMILREATTRQKSTFIDSDITMPQVVVLELLLEKEKCKMGEVAKTLNLSMSAITSIVDKMIDAAMVSRERSTEDRRVVEVELTKKGKEIAKRVSKEREDMANDLFSVLTKEERKEYLRLLKKVFSSAKRK